MPKLLLPSDRKYLSSNGATANVVHRDFDLHFQGHKISNENISKTVRLSKKCSSMSFIEVEICHRMGPFLVMQML